MDKKQHQQYVSYDDQTGIGEIHDKPNGNPWARRQMAVGEDAFKTHGGVLALAMLIWLLVMLVVLSSDAAIGWKLLAASPVVLLIVFRAKVPKYPEEDWDIEKD